MKTFIEVDSKDKPFEHTCDQCGYKSATIKEYSFHIRKSPDHLPICKQCDSKFSNMIYLRDHVRRYHFRGGKVSCIDCGKISNSQQQHYAHWLFLHKVHEDLYCNLCYSPWKNMLQLKRHMRKCLIKYPAVVEAERLENQSKSEIKFVHNWTISEYKTYAKDLSVKEAEEKAKKIKSPIKKRPGRKKKIVSIKSEMTEDDDEDIDGDKKLEVKNEIPDVKNIKILDYRKDNLDQLNIQTLEINLDTFHSSAKNEKSIADGNNSETEDRDYRDKNYHNMDFEKESNDNLVHQKSRNIKLTLKLNNYSQSEKREEAFNGNISIADNNDNLGDNDQSDADDFDRDSDDDYEEDNEKSIKEEKGKNEVKFEEETFEQKLEPADIKSEVNEDDYDFDDEDQNSTEKVENVTEGLKNEGSLLGFTDQLKNNIKELMKTDGGVNCELCGFFTKNLRAHMWKHHKPTPVPCPKCGITLKSETFLKRHLKKVHGKDEVVCPLCGKLTRNLKAHNNFVHKEAKCPCDICGKVFDNSLKLGNHKRKIHIYKERNQVVYDNLPDNEKITWNNSQVCNICGKSVVNAQSHYRYVHEENPVPCDICGTVLMNYLKFKKHKAKVHPPKEIVTCETCGAVFENRFKLYHHNYAVHSYQESKCEICGKTYKNVKALNSHKKWAHKQEEGGTKQMTLT